MYTCRYYVILFAKAPPLDKGNSLCRITRITTVSQVAI